MPWLRKAAVAVILQSCTALCHQADLTDARSRSPVLLWPLAGSRRPRRHVGFRRSTLRNHVLRRQNSRLEQKAGDARADQRCDDEQPNLSERMQLVAAPTMAGPSERAGLTEVPVTLIPSRWMATSVKPIASPASPTGVFGADTKKPSSFSRVIYYLQSGMFSGERNRSRSPAEPLLQLAFLPRFEFLQPKPQPDHD